MSKAVFRCHNSIAYHLARIYPYGSSHDLTSNCCTSGPILLTISAIVYFYNICVVSFLQYCMVPITATDRHNLNVFLGPFALTLNLAHFNHISHHRYLSARLSQFNLRSAVICSLKLIMACMSQIIMESTT